jgi:hypothetical protein
MKMIKNKRLFKNIGLVLGVLAFESLLFLSFGYYDNSKQRYKCENAINRHYNISDNLESYCNESCIRDKLEEVIYDLDIANNHSMGLDEAYRVAKERCGEK